MSESECSDHADTIRGGIDSLRWVLRNVNNAHTTTFHEFAEAAERDSKEALAALDALLAERQQAQAERDELAREVFERNEQQVETWRIYEVTARQRDEAEAERQQAQEERLDAISQWEKADAEARALQVERQQAIDALRWLAKWSPGEFGDKARAALVKLGETP